MIISYLCLFVMINQAGLITRLSTQLRDCKQFYCLLVQFQIGHVVFNIIAHDMDVVNRVISFTLILNIWFRVFENNTIAFW